ncbi:MAG: DUF11 domain-containing protein [Thermoflexales bacterium]|nr:DUF11 domain-containing protein [Thermoflexales bacterium]
MRSLRVPRSFVHTVNVLVVLSLLSSTSSPAPAAGHGSSALPTQVVNVSTLPVFLSSIVWAKPTLSLAPSIPPAALNIPAAPVISQADVESQQADFLPPQVYHPHAYLVYFPIVMKNYPPVSSTLSLDMGMAAHPGLVEAGQDVTFTVALSNPNDAPLAGLLLSATLPGELDWVSHQAGWDYDEPDRRVSAKVGTLAPGAEISSTLRLRTLKPEHVPLGQSKKATLAIEARQDAPAGYGPLADASASVTITLPATPTLALTLAVWPEIARPGRLVTFTLTLSNTGTTPASGLALRAAIPKGLHWVQDQPGWVYDGSAKCATLELGLLPPGAVRVLTFYLHTSGPLDSPATLAVEALYEKLVVGRASATVWIVHPTRGVEGVLDKSVTPWLAWPGGAVTYTLSVRNPGNHPLKNGVVVDRLPGEIEVIEAEGADYDPQTRELRWEPGQIKPGQSVTLSVLARPAAGVEMAVVHNSAVLSAEAASLPQPMTATAEATLYVGGSITATITPTGGLISVLDGLTTLDFPPGAVTETVVVTVSVPVTLPAPLEWSTVYRGYALDVRLRALNGGTPVTTTLRPVTITLQYAALPTLGETVWEPWLGVYHYDGARGEWGYLRTQVATDTGVLTATTLGFSALALAEDKLDTGWKLLYNPPQLATFSGAATYNYPIEAPPGRNGLQPALNLSYNSRRVDGIVGWVDSGWVGLGWSLDTVEIVRDEIDVEHSGPEDYYLDYDPSFTLLLNGTGHKLYAGDGVVNHGRYYAKNAPGLYVLRVNDLCTPATCDGFEGGAATETGDYWIVHLPDGSQVTLGSQADSEQVIAPVCSTYGCGDWASDAKYGGRQAGQAVYRWRADTFTDTFGNRIQVHYTECHSDDGGRDSASWPAWIGYNADEQGRWGTEIRFETAGCGDQPGAITKDDKIIFGRHPQLDAIWISHLGQDVRHVKLGYQSANKSNNAKIRRLTSIQEFDGQGQQALPATVFGYENYANKGFCLWDPWRGWCKPHRQETYQYPRLVRIYNGFGALDEFSYAHDDRANDNDLGYAYRVVTHATYDGQSGQPAVRSYAYGTPCYHVLYEGHGTQCVSPDSKKALVGFDVVTETAHGYDGEWLAGAVHHFHVENGPDQSESPVLGRGRYAESLAEDGRVLQTAETLWAYSLFGNGVPFVYARAVTATQEGQVRWAAYEYDPALQGGTQYGNLTSEYDYGDADLEGDERTIYRQYVPSPGGWVVNKPAWEKIYEGVVDDPAAGPALKTEVLYHYDGAQSVEAAPAQGALTWMRRGRAGDVWQDAYTSYDAWGNPQVVTDALGHVATTQYDEAYHLYPVQTTNAKGHTSSVEYYGLNAAGAPAGGGQPGQVWRTWDANGTETANAFVYDSLGRLTRLIRPGDTVTLPTTSLVYAHPLPAQPYSNGGFEEDELWTSPNGTIWSYTAEQTHSGSRALKIDTTGWGNDWVGENHTYLSGWQAGHAYWLGAWVYVSQGQVTLAVSYRYCVARKPNGQCDRHEDGSVSIGVAGASGAWQFVYGPVVLPPGDFAGKRVTFYPTPGTLAYVDDVVWGPPLTPLAIETRQREQSGKAGELVTLEFYDGLGRLLQTRAEAENNQQMVTNLAYDALGRVQYAYAPEFEPFSQAMSRPDGWQAQARTTTEYDGLGRTVAITAPDGTTTRSTYVGRTTIVTDANGHRKDSVADAFDRLVAVREYSGTEVYTTSYAYNILGNLTGVTDTLGNTTVITYDTLGRKTGMHDPDMDNWRYGYDPAGNLLYQVDAKRQAVNFYYDELSRPVGKTYATEVVDAASYQRPDPPPDNKYNVWYDYDEGQYGIGQRTSMGNRQASSAWSYDERGRMVRESKTIGEIGPFDTTYSFDALDRVVSTTYPDGEVVEQSYNAGAQPDSLGSSQGETFVSGTEYNALGQPVRVGYGSGLETRYAYFGLDTAQQWGNQFYGRLFQVCVIQGGADCPANDQSDALLNLSYWYDAGGNVTAIRDRTPAGDNQVQHFVYDSLDRLRRGYTDPQGSGVGDYDESYTYNAIGNLLSKGEVTYTYADKPGDPRPHAVTDLSDGSHFEYDANGNMTLRVEVGPTQTLTYEQEFDVENRLVAVTARGGVEAVTRFYYDGDGARVAQVTQAGTTIYVGDHYELFFPDLDLSQAERDIFQLAAGSGAQTGARIETAPGMGQSLLVYLDNVSYTPGGLPYGDVVGQWLDEAGERVGAPFVIANATEVEQFYRPYISYNPYNRRFLVTMPASSAAGGSRVAYALVDVAGTVGALHYVGAGEWTAGLERMIVSEAHPVDGTWLLFWDGGKQGQLSSGPSWGSCGLALLVDANGAPVGEPLQVTEWGAMAGSQIVPAVAFDPGDQRWLLVWSTNPHGSPRRVLGRFVGPVSLTPTLPISISISVSIATTYRDAFAPAMAYNAVEDEFLVAFTVNGLVNLPGQTGGVNRSWELVYQRVLADGTLPGGVEAPVLLDKHGTHNWTDANSLEVVSGTGEYLLSYASVRDGGGFFTGPYDVRQFRLDGQGANPTNGLVSDYTPRATDGEYDVAVGDGGSVLAVWSDLRDGTPHIWGRRYGVGDELPTPRVTKYYYHGGQRVAMRDGDVVYYLHGDHLGSTSLATYGSGPQMGQPVQDSRVWYYPYGEVRYGGDGLPTDFGFTGQKAVPGTGLMYYKARYYHPVLGRFVSADSIVPNALDPQLLNHYSYAGDNPVLYIDKNGHLPILPVLIAVVALLGLLASGCSGPDQTQAVLQSTVIIDHNTETQQQQGNRIIVRQRTPASISLGTVVGPQSVLTHGHYAPGDSLQDPSYTAESLTFYNHEGQLIADIPAANIAIPMSDNGTTLLVGPNLGVKPALMGDPTDLKVGDRVLLVYKDANGQAAVLRSTVEEMSATQGGIPIARIKDPLNVGEVGDSGGGVFDTRGRLIGNNWWVGLNADGLSVAFFVALLPENTSQNVR